MNIPEPSDGPLTLVDAAADLAFGARCVGCHRAGRLLCARCRAALPAEPVPAWPSPTPVGLTPPYAMGEYDGLLRALVVGYKEHGWWSLGGPLTQLLAGSVDGLRHDLGLIGPLVLVPVPSRRASVRARARDSTAALTRAVARHLDDSTACSERVLCVPLLRLRVGVVDQAGLGAESRRANLTGAMTCPSVGLRRLARRTGQATVVVCDDVITTGSSAAEAQRALTAVGLPVAGIAVVAATRRRIR